MTRSNNFPSNVAAYYLEAAKEFKDCPIDHVTDLGTEKGIMAGIGTIDLTSQLEKECLWLCFGG